MAVLKVNPALHISWIKGRTILQVPGWPSRVLNDSTGLALLAEFARPRRVGEVRYEPSMPPPPDGSLARAQPVSAVQVPGLRDAQAQRRRP
jgi:hypothetical protein